MLYKLAVFLLGLYTRLFYNVTYSYEEPLPSKGPFILVGKHISNTDVFFIGTHLKYKIYHLAKAILFKKKFYAKVLTSLGAMPVTHDAGSLSSLKNAIHILKNGNVLCVYPEGTRIRNNELHEGGSGTALIAKMSKCDIIPFGIYVKDYTVKHFSKVYVHFGKRITYKELSDRNVTKDNYSDTMKRIMLEIKRLSEADYENHFSQ